MSARGWKGTLGVIILFGAGSAYAAAPPPEAATCLACQTVLPPERVCAQLVAQRGGADVRFNSKGERIGGARMLAVVSLHPKKDGRQYRVVTGSDYAAVFKVVS